MKTQIQRPDQPMKEARQQVQVKKLDDARPEAAAQVKLQAMAAASPRAIQLRSLQAKANEADARQKDAPPTSSTKATTQLEGDDDSTTYLAVGMTLLMLVLAYVFNRLFPNLEQGQRDGLLADAANKPEVRRVVGAARQQNPNASPDALGDKVETDVEQQVTGTAHGSNSETSITDDASGSPNIEDEFAQRTGPATHPSLDDRSPLENAVADSESISHAGAGRTSKKRHQPKLSKYRKKQIKNAEKSASSSYASSSPDYEDAFREAEADAQREAGLEEEFRMGEIEFSNAFRNRTRATGLVFWVLDGVQYHITTKVGDNFHVTTSAAKAEQARYFFKFEGVKVKGVTPTLRERGAIGTYTSLDSAPKKVQKFVNQHVLDLLPGQ
jgi:hypothetical protein